VPLTAKDVAEIARLLEESDFLELRIEHEGFKLTLKRGSVRGAAGDNGPGEAAAAAASARWSGAASAPAPREPARAQVHAAADPSLIDVTAPLLGIFYRAARPGAAPYVEVGSEIQEDTIVGIIEVMKLMNSVRAEVRGRVVEILVEDGAAVESGQVLLRLARGDRDG
jgi:acetyl-CoA carboxylase biotin carboxyl carrier protein